MWERRSCRRSGCRTRPPRRPRFPVEPRPTDDATAAAGRQNDRRQARGSASRLPAGLSARFAGRDAQFRRPSAVPDRAARRRNPVPQILVDDCPACDHAFEGREVGRPDPAVGTMSVDARNECAFGSSSRLSVSKERSSWTADGIQASPQALSLPGRPFSTRRGRIPLPARSRPAAQPAGPAPMIRTEGGAPVGTKIQMPTIAPTLSGKWMTMSPGSGSRPNLISISCIGVQSMATISSRHFFRSAASAGTLGSRLFR